MLTMVMFMKLYTKKSLLLLLIVEIVRKKGGILMQEGEIKSRKWEKKKDAAQVSRIPFVKRCTLQPLLLDHK